MFKEIQSKRGDFSDFERCMVVGVSHVGISEIADLLGL